MSRGAIFHSETSKALLVIGYHLGALVTLIKRTFFDHSVYNWWNWIIVIPINIFLAEIWPIYWLLLRPLMGFLFG